MPDGKLYVYGSNDESRQYYCSNTHHVLSSSDMTTWEIKKDIFMSKGVNDKVSYSDCLLYAPDCIEKEGKYYVSGLPWFSAIDSSQAGHFSEDNQLQLTANDHASDSQHKKVEKFLEVFFTNYTTNQDNLNLIAKNVTIVANTTFKTIDYTYLKKDGADLIAYVQATFEVGGTTHSENFTFTLSEKDKSYYVTKLEHTIPLNYANDKD